MFSTQPTQTTPIKTLILFFKRLNTCFQIINFVHMSNHFSCHHVSRPHLLGIDSATSPWFILDSANNPFFSFHTTTNLFFTHDVAITLFFNHKSVGKTPFFNPNLSKPVEVIAPTIVLTSTLLQIHH